MDCIRDPCPQIEVRGEVVCLEPMDVDGDESKTPGAGGRC